ncbi:MAG: SusC/RagA family TonB-linked outer membrane protein [Candidatus Pedobacter colombiensis]|uniref:SusC/RagA family TonB-linked outer membrane protein n=1 Tax=Candidatus Pedobacter colombiensis TaxID=3121371 RepID=A0AAJ6B6G8_9SPHI|nr:SusC/RagA family TonB-linked outer membrane protein [Pedobacter sp.]WEK19937.1 MAG: SusC/RagA family TonB-linked outer membrane protein [Pedobacter sp.]
MIYYNLRTKLMAYVRKEKKWIMRINLTVFIMTVSLLQVNASSFAQKITLHEKNTSFEAIINKIQSQSGYDFIGNTILIRNARPISINIKAVSLTDALELCFANQELTYTLKDKTVIIKHRLPSLLDKVVDFFTAIEIRGKVLDEKGFPLPGTTVKVKSTGKTAFTNTNGEFVLDNLNEKDIVQFYFVGYKTKEIAATALKTNPTIKLEVKTGELDEVAVVFTGYQKIKTEQLTGATSTINNKAYESPIVTNNFLQGLQNKLAGVLINGDLKFEGNSLFQIRGISTISATKQPLVVVDGYPTELSLDGINPNEIESVTVLKDAAAAAIYGVRASNGVIIVERKKAVKGDPKFAFRSTLSITPKEDYTTYRFAPTSTKMRYNIDAYDRYPYPKNFYPNSPQRYSAGDEPLLDLSDGLITRAEAEKRMADQYAYDNTADYSKYFEQNKVTQQYDFNLSGGTEKALYYVSSNFTRNQNSKIKSNDQRFLLSGRGSYNFNDKLSFIMTTDFIQTKNNSVPVFGLNDFYSFERFQDDNGNPKATFAGSPINPLFSNAMIAQGYFDNMSYPLRDINEVSDRGMTTSNKIVGDLLYKFIPGLSLKVGGVYEFSTTTNKHIATENASEIKQYVNNYSEVGTDGIIKFNLPKGGYNKTKVATTTGYTLRAQLNYDKKLSEDHAINVIIGAETRKVTAELNGFANFGYNDQTLLQQPVDYNKILTGTWSNPLYYPNPQLSFTDLFQKTFEDNRYVSAYFNGVYTFKSKYTLSGSMRIDQSNLFGTDPKYRYKPLWSVGAAWNVDKEAFMEQLAWVDHLKLRASKGFNGNVSKVSLPQIIANYANNLRTSPTSTGLNILSLENSALRWEETNNFNAGLDFTIFKRITGSIDFYSKKSKDLLGNTGIDPTKGASSAVLNSAKLDNKGFEIALNSDWIQRKSFNWNTGIAFSYNTSKVRDVYQNSTKFNYNYVDGSNINNYIVGYPVGSLFSYRAAGLNADGLPTVYDKNNNIKKLTSSNDEGLNDLEYSGNGIPPYAIGISNRFDIGPFYFYAMIDLYTGFKTRIPRPSPSSNRPQEGAENYFKTPGDEAKTDVMGFYNISTIDFSHDFPAYNNSNKYVVNGSYLLLRDVTVSYRLNNQFLKTIGFSNFEIKAQGSNLYTKGFNKYNYSPATGDYMRRNLVPTFTIGLFTNF